MLLTSLLIVSTVAYLVLMAAYWFAWLRCVPANESGGEPRIRISVVIAARNEQDFVGACIQSLLRQRYPKELIEFIIVDDDSEDDTAKIIAAFKDARIRYLKMAPPAPSERVVSFKKRALSAGIALAKGEWIVTTDADCIAPEDWIRTLSSQFGAEDTVMLVAPVRFFNSGSLVEQFQQFDFMMMQGITAAVCSLDWGVMCNGANLAFRKDAFVAVGAYAGVDHIVSGDDYLLMLKMRQRYPNGIRYVQSPAAAVDTRPQPDWSSFLQQRLRWASKSGKYADPPMTRALFLVFLFNFSLLLSVCFVFREPLLPLILCVSLALKIAIEAAFLRSIGKVYPLRASLWLFPFLQPVHIIYITLIGFLSRFGRFRWKGRDVIAS